MMHKRLKQLAAEGNAPAFSDNAGSSTTVRSTTITGLNDIDRYSKQ